MAPTPKIPKPKSPLLDRDKRPPGDPGYTPVHMPKHAPGDRVPGREVPTQPPSWRGPQDKSGNRVNSAPGLLPGSMEAFVHRLVQAGHEVRIMAPKGKK